MGSGTHKLFRTLLHRGRFQACDQTDPLRFRRGGLLHPLQGVRHLEEHSTRHHTIRRALARGFHSGMSRLPYDNLQHARFPIRRTQSAGVLHREKPLHSKRSHDATPCSHLPDGARLHRHTRMQFRTPHGAGNLTRAHNVPFAGMLRRYNALPRRGEK